MNPITKALELSPIDAPYRIKAKLPNGQVLFTHAFPIESIGAVGLRIKESGHDVLDIISEKQYQQQQKGTKQ